MDKRITERVDKCKIILELCSNNSTIVDGLPAFKAGVTYVNTEVTAIQEQMKPLMLDGTGIAETKKLAKKKAASLFDPLCGALMAYADATGNPELRAAANFTESAIFKIRDEEMTQTCEALIDLANVHLENLSDYGYTAGDIAEASIAVAAFEKFNPKPIENRSVDKAERENLLERSRALNAYVGKQFKNTAKRFKMTHPEFYAQLINAMRNQNRGIRHRLSEEESALRKAIRAQKTAESAAQKAAAREAAALARNADIQAQLDALASEAPSNGEQPVPLPAASENGVLAA